MSSSLSSSESIAWPRDETSFELCGDRLQCAVLVLSEIFICDPGYARDERLRRETVPVKQSPSFSMDDVVKKLCGCLSPFLESPEQKERRVRRQVIERGAQFQKKNYTFGFSFGQSEAVTLKAQESAETGNWVMTWSAVAVDSNKSGVIKFGDIARVEPKGDDSFCLTAGNGDLLLEAQAEDVVISTVLFVNYSEVL